MNQCAADNYRDRQRDREREESQSLYCKDLNPQNQLDMEHVNLKKTSFICEEIFDLGYRMGNEIRIAFINSRSLSQMPIR